MTGMLIVEFEDEIGGTDDGVIQLGLVSPDERDRLIARWTEAFAKLHIESFRFLYEED